MEEFEIVFIADDDQELINDAVLELYSIGWGLDEIVVYIEEEYDTIMTEDEVEAIIEASYTIGTA